jgi:hypothetical protein
VGRAILPTGRLSVGLCDRNDAPRSRLQGTNCDALGQARGLSYSTTMVAVLELTPPTEITTGTALPAATEGGTSTFT